MARHFSGEIQEVQRSLIDRRVRRSCSRSWISCSVSLELRGGANRQKTRYSTAIRLSTARGTVAQAGELVRGLPTEWAAQMRKGNPVPGYSKGARAFQRGELEVFGGIAACNSTPDELSRFPNLASLGAMVPSLRVRPGSPRNLSKLPGQYSSRKEQGIGSGQAMAST